MLTVEILRRKLKDTRDKLEFELLFIREGEKKEELLRHREQLARLEKEIDKVEKFMEQ